MNSQQTSSSASRIIRHFPRRWSADNVDASATGISRCSAGGGAWRFAIKNEKRGELEILLRQEASYVQGIAGQNLPTLLAIGGSMGYSDWSDPVSHMVI